MEYDIVNCQAKVKLTSYGLRILEEFYIEDIDRIRSMKIGDRQYKIPLHELFMIFGDYCYIEDGPFVNNIIELETR
jgi:hypothetical protein